MVNGKDKGSITVEAALVLPIFLYGILAFLYLIRIFYVQECIQAGLTEVAKEASRYGYVYEDVHNSKEDGEKNSLGERLVGSSFYTLRLENYLDKWQVGDSCILGGRKGIVLLMSSFMEQDASIDVIAVYRIKIPVAFFSFNGFSMVQRVKTRGFVGLDDSGSKAEDQTGTETEDPIVYITENGEVYHFNRDCSHIKLSIQKTLFGQVEELRNVAGEKYKPCEYCAQHAQLSTMETVFITEDGNRYHTTLECSGLKRTVKAVHLSEVEDRRECSRCR